MPRDVESIADFNVLMALETESLALDPATVRRGVARVVGDAAKGRYFVASAEDRPDEAVACLLVTFEWSDWRDGELWWVQSVYVRPDWRRRGVFRGLYAHVRDVAHAAGAGGLRLYVEHDNEAAQETYVRVGMRRTGYLVMEEVPLSHPTKTGGD